MKDEIYNFLDKISDDLRFGFIPIDETIEENVEEVAKKLDQVIGIAKIKDENNEKFIFKLIVDKEKLKKKLKDEE